jgi:hypothetical protein
MRELLASIAAALAVTSGMAASEDGPAEAYYGGYNPFYPRAVLALIPYGRRRVACRRRARVAAAWADTGGRRKETVL